MTTRLASRHPDRRRPAPPDRLERRPTDPKPTPLNKPTGPLVYTVSKGADVFPTGRKT